MYNVRENKELNVRKKNVCLHHTSSSETSSLPVLGFLASIK